MVCCFIDLHALKNFEDHGTILYVYGFMRDE